MLPVVVWLLIFLNALSMAPCWEKSTSGSCPTLTGVADARNPEVLNALVLLMQNLDNPSVLTDEQLVAAAIDARETKKTAEVTVATELARRGWSWRRIGKALGVDHATAYLWVNPRPSKANADARDASSDE